MVGQHRHRRAVRPPGAGEPVPRQQRRRHLRPRLQLVRRRRHVRRTAPCDTNGHGTHTMGTMVGDDGAANQIGVAPGAKWIAANGCCPSDAALISSGQWMLAPTDLEGENPDVTKRPNIVNNSWGSQVPSNDPFMEDVQEAWAASGIFGSWSNGNSGPACQTSGSPGSRIINYSVGAYDVNNNIAGFSGTRRRSGRRAQAEHLGTRRQRPVQPAGQRVRRVQRHVDGRTAPGRHDRPALVGRTVAASVTSTPRARCSTAPRSTPAPRPAAARPTTTTSSARAVSTRWRCSTRHRSATPARSAGTVTDAASGDPIEGAEVELAGETSRTLTTGADGTYSVRVTAGEYTVTASAYGYETETATITVAGGRRPDPGLRARRRRHGHRVRHRGGRIRPRLAAVREGQHRRSRHRTPSPTRAPGSTP